VPGVPRLVVKLVYDGGGADEPPQLKGANQWLSDLRPRPQLAGNAGRALEVLTKGTSTKVWHGDDGVTFTVRGLSEFSGLALSGLAAWVRQPALAPSEFEQQRQRILARLEAPRDAFRELDSALRAACYGASHPYASSPSSQAVGSVQRGAVESFLSSELDLWNATLVVVGDFDEATVEARARELFSGASRPRALPGPPVPPLPSRPVRWAVTGPPGPQVQLGISYPVPERGEEGWAATVLVRHLLAIAAQRPHDHDGAPYGIEARYDRRRGVSRYVVTGAVDALRAGEALRGLREAITDLTEGPQFEDAFLKARRQILRDLVADARSLEAMAHQLEDQARLQLPPDHQDRLVRTIAELTPAAARALVRDQLRAEREIVVLVGEDGAVKEAFATAGIADFVAK
jgi:predicted Zn-dependent peptidase